MIRTKGEPGTGDIVQAVRHMRKMNSEISKLVSMREDELFEAAKQLQVPVLHYQVLHQVQINHDKISSISRYLLQQSKYFLISYFIISL